MRGRFARGGTKTLRCHGRRPSFYDLHRARNIFSTVGWGHKGRVFSFVGAALGRDLGVLFGGINSVLFCPKVGGGHKRALFLHS